MDFEHNPQNTQNKDNSSAAVTTIPSESVSSTNDADNNSKSDNLETQAGNENGNDAQTKNKANKNQRKSNPIKITEDFAQLFSDSVDGSGYENRAIEGTVIAMDKDHVMVDIGLKSEGRIPIWECKVVDPDTYVQIGDKMEVYIERFEGKGGNVVLSREKALRNQAWQYFRDLYNDNASVDGVVLGRVKGGFAVELGGIIAFLPGSQVDIRPIKNISALIGMTQPFKILKMDEVQGNVVVSRRMILEEMRKDARTSLLSNIEEGTILEGTVKNITDYGAFIDLQSTDGLLHITDISWSKISHPSEVLKLGETLKVMVIKYNPDSERISLGLKQLTKNPWEALQEKYKADTLVKGKIVNVVDYGVFVELEPNIEGLVYYTEIGWLTKNIHPSKLVNIGDEVDVKVLCIDTEKHRISLSMKRCLENPWISFAEKHPIGTMIKCAVRNVSDFGLFVTLEEDQDKTAAIIMLIPSIELTWGRNHTAELKNYSKGDIVEAVILTSDPERERISASVRRLSEDTVSTQIQELVAQESSKAKVLAIKEDGIVVELIDNFSSFVPRAEISKHREEQDPHLFTVGQSIDLKVLAFDPNKRFATVSIRALYEMREHRIMEEYGSTSSGGGNNADGSKGDMHNEKDDNNGRGGFGDALNDAITSSSSASSSLKS